MPGPRIRPRAYDLRDWLRKLRIHPRYRHYTRGHPVEPQKLLWMELVDELPDAALREYYRRTVAFTPEQLRPLTRRRWTHPWRQPHVVEVSAIADAFASHPDLQGY